jgi:hypothetical protein
MWIVKIPKAFRTYNDMAKFVGPFTSCNEAEKWVQSTFENYQAYLFSYTRVDKP